MTTRFEIARQIGVGQRRPVQADGAAAGRRSRPSRSWPNALYYATLSADARRRRRATALAQAVSPQDWNTLLLSSPEFMR